MLPNVHANLNPNNIQYINPKDIVPCAIPPYNQLPQNQLNLRIYKEYATLSRENPDIGYNFSPLYMATLTNVEHHKQEINSILNSSEICILLHSIDRKVTNLTLSPEDKQQKIQNYTKNLQDDYNLLKINLSPNKEERKCLFNIRYSIQTSLNELNSPLEQERKSIIESIEKVRVLKENLYPEAQQQVNASIIHLESQL